MQERTEQISYYEKIKEDYSEALIILKQLKEEKEFSLSPQLQNEE